MICGIAISLIAALVPLFSYAIGGIVKSNRQKSFASTVPAGDYSGVVAIGDGRYAVVSDKSATDGFFVFRIDIDTVSGKIRSVVNEGFRSSGQANRDQEGIAFVPQWNTLFVSGEADNRIREYALDGRLTGRELAVPEEFAAATANYGFESLSYNAATHRFWTITESTLPADGVQATSTRHVSNRLRLQSFDESLRPAEQYFYQMDAPTAKREAAHYAMGVSELCAADDGDVVVLEREFYVSKKKFGSFVNCKLYVVHPDTVAAGSLLPKRLLTEIRTKLTLVNYRIANYEGLCLGPRLAGGGRVLLLLSDSQSRYGGVLKDWFKTVVVDYGVR